MERILNVMMQRLAKKGITIDTMPAYIRDLANAITSDQVLSLKELNRKMHLLGWDNFELDDHTLQLVIANLENSAFNNFDFFNQFKFQNPLGSHKIARNHNPYFLSEE